MNSWNCIVQRFDVVDSADVAKAPICYHPLLGRSINALIFILLTTCKMQKVDYLGFCRSYSKTKPIFGILVSCAIGLHKFHDCNFRGLISRQGKRPSAKGWCSTLHPAHSSHVYRKQNALKGHVYVTITDFATYAHYSSCVFFLKHINILCTNGSSVICTCIELCGSVVEHLLINQSILFFVGSNPDASTLFFSPKPTYWRYVIDGKKMLVHLARAEIFCAKFELTNKKIQFNSIKKDVYDASYGVRSVSIADVPGV